MGNRGYLKNLKGENFTSEEKLFRHSYYLLGDVKDTNDFTTIETNGILYVHVKCSLNGSRFFVQERVKGRVIVNIYKI